jgi:sugar phosphate isomerase/epimerase
MKVGIDNYGLFPLGLSPLQTLQWALGHGAEGVAFSGFGEAERSAIDDTMLDRIRDFAAGQGLYLEWGGGQHVPRNLVTWESKDIFNHNLVEARAAARLGTRIIRSCSGGLMRWNPDAVPTRQLLDEAAAALCAQRQMLLDHQVILAIETHFEFTTFELVRLFEACGAKPGEWLGICLDTMNLLTMLEDPVMATERILPWVVSTHIKDGGIIETETGFQSFTAPFGDGIIDFKSIFNLLTPNLLTSLPHLNIEDHGGSFDIPIFDPVFRKEFPDLADAELEQLVLLSRRTRKKMDSGELSILDRKDWPGVCEGRMAGDMEGLKTLAIRKGLR